MGSEKVIYIWIFCCRGIEKVSVGEEIGGGGWGGASGALLSIPANTRLSHRVGLTLGQCLWRWTNISPYINPSNRHDASKHNFCISEHSWKMAYKFLHIGVLERQFSWNCFYTNNDIFFLFDAHFKSSLSTTSRELRQQFAACSGWRWQW